MIKRKAAPLVRRRLREYPAVALVGPRQAGKTTLARSFRGRYFDLEQEADRLRLDLGWHELSGGDRLVILDEAQAWPEVFPLLRGAIDRNRKRNGRFLILGSVSPALMTQVSESLAGRLSLVELTPLLLEEAGEGRLDSMWLRGGYPDGGALHPKRFPQWQRDYLDLITQRDLPNWGLPSRPQVTQRLLRMLAAVHGQLSNASQIGQSMGLSYATVNAYTDYLAGAFLIRRLLPYRANLRKRLVRSPKCYWRDTGLLHALLLVGNERELLDRPWVGASWEGFVIEQVLGSLLQSGRHVEPYFFRTSDRYEIDLVLDFGGSLWAVEIKLTARPSTVDLKRLSKTADLMGAERRVLISRTAESYSRGKQVSCDLPWFLRYLRRAT
jgi:predicted AAA+ superfamily ATPase